LSSPEHGIDGMEGSGSSKLRVLEDTTAAIVPEGIASMTGRPLSRSHYPTSYARRLYACEAFHPHLSVHAADSGPDPYSVQWFLNIEHHRFSRRGCWIPHLLEFAKHPGETLLGVGNGLGTDWLQYARYGAAVVVCCPSSAQLSLIRRNFELRN